MGLQVMALELAGDRVRAAMANRAYKALELLGLYEERRIGDEADLSGAITRVLDTAGRPDIVISALPAEFVAKRLLALPFTDRRRLLQVVAFALEEHLPFAVDDATVAFARVGHEGPNTLVMAAVARKDDLRHHLELLGRAGLDPKTVTLAPLALAGLLARARNGLGGRHLMLNIDHAASSMVLLDAAGTPRALRTLTQGLEIGDGALITQASITAIIGALRQTILAHSGEHDAPELVLTGPVAGSDEIRGHIADALAVAVHDLGEFDCSALIQGIEPDPARFAGCLAMLLGETPAKPLELLNFRQGEFAYQGSTGENAPLRLSLTLAAVAVGAALLHLVLGISANARILHKVNREIATVAAPALGAADPAAAKTAMAAKLATMTKQLRLMGGNLGYGSPLDVMLAISRAIPPGLPAQVTSLSIDDSGVKIEGTADSFATVDLVQKALERYGSFGAIEVEHAAAASDPGKVEFRLNTSLKDSVKGSNGPAKGPANEPTN